MSLFAATLLNGIVGNMFSQGNSNLPTAANAQPIQPPAPRPDNTLLYIIIGVSALILITVILVIALRKS